MVNGVPFRPSDHPPYASDLSARVIYGPGWKPDHWTHNGQEYFHYSAVARSYFWHSTKFTRHVYGPSCIDVVEYWENWAGGSRVAFGHKDVAMAHFVNGAGRIPSEDIAAWAKENQHGEVNLLGSKYFLDDVDQIDFIGKFMLT